MKRLYAAAALLLLIIAIGFAERHFANTAAWETLDKIETAEADGLTLSSCTDVRDTWLENKPALELFMPHPDLDSADLAADKLVLYADLGDKENVLIYISELKDRMKAIAEAEEINIYNLM